MKREAFDKGRAGYVLEEPRLGWGQRVLVPSLRDSYS
jgi:hypothetical protein